MTHPESLYRLAATRHDDDIRRAAQRRLAKELRPSSPRPRRPAWDLLPPGLDLVARGVRSLLAPRSQPARPTASGEIAPVR